MPASKGKSVLVKAKKKTNSQADIAEAHDIGQSQLQATLNEYKSLEAKKKMMDHLIKEKEAELKMERKLREKITAENKVLQNRLNELREEMFFKEELAEDRRAKMRSENAQTATQLDLWKKQLYAVMAKHEISTRTAEPWERKSLQEIAGLFDALVEQLNNQQLDRYLVKLLVEKLGVQIEHNSFMKKQAHAREQEMDADSDETESSTGWTTSVSIVDSSETLSTGRVDDEKQSGIQAQMRAIYGDVGPLEVRRPIEEAPGNSKSKSPRVQEMLKSMAPNVTKGGVGDDVSPATLVDAKKDAYRTFMKELLSGKSEGLQKKRGK